MRRSLAVLDFLDDGTEEFEAIGNAINAKATTVDRVLNSPAMKEALGIDIDRKTGKITFANGDERAGRRALRDIILKMADPKFRFSEIRDSGDRDAFVRSFAPQPSSSATPEGGSGNGTTVAPPSGPSAPPPAPPQQSSPSAGPSGVPPAPIPTVPPTTRRPPLTDPVRTTLAPKGGSRAFTVKGVRLNKLYAECRNIELSGNENAAALLLRVFIELSSEAILIEKNVPIPPKLTAKRNVTLWSDHGANLSAKINAVMDFVDPAKKNKQLQPARLAIDPNNHAPFAINTLHGYFHNLAMNPDAAAVRAAWDGWEDYLRLLHEARK